MQQLTLCAKWIEKEFEYINNTANRKWLSLFLLFSVSWFVAGHLIFIKKYQRALWYLAAWVITLGSWIIRESISISIALFSVGILLLCLLFVTDMFFVFVDQRRRLKTNFSIFILFCFSIQVLAYEYIINTNLLYIKDTVSSLVSSFTDFSFPR